MKEVREKRQLPGQEVLIVGVLWFTTEHMGTANSTGIAPHGWEQEIAESKGVSEGWHSYPSVFLLRMHGQCQAQSILYQWAKQDSGQPEPGLHRQS